MKILIECGNSLRSRIHILDWVWIRGKMYPCVWKEVEWLLDIHKVIIRIGNKKTKKIEE